MYWPRFDLPVCGLHDIRLSGRRLPAIRVTTRMMLYSRLEAVVIAATVTPRPIKR